MRILAALLTFGLLQTSMGQMEGSGSLEGSGDAEENFELPKFRPSTSKPSTIVLAGEDNEDADDMYLVSSGDEECEGSGNCEELTTPLPTMKVTERSTTVAVEPYVGITAILSVKNESGEIEIEIGGDNGIGIIIEETSTPGQLPTRKTTRGLTRPVTHIQTDPPTFIKPDPTEGVKPVEGGEYGANAGSNDDSTVRRTEVTVPPLIGHPGILAAVIGGGVVALLCAILLVMFIVYRMMKKDEGSYPLDDKPRHTAYTTVPSKEFYA